MTNRMKAKNLLGAVLLLGLGYFFLIMAVPAQAEEKILSFHSDLTINSDASLTVTETITVRAENNQIKRGIYRDFPTRYRGKYGLIRRVGFQVREVLRDGESESFHSEGISIGKRVYFGRKEVILPPGEYTYTFVYETDRQLGFFPEFDELYWNVTGNDWNFPIEKASAVVHLPEGAGGKVIAVSAYTGLKGATGQGFQQETDPASGTVRFFTTRPLALGEGLTLAVSWPKGAVTATGQTGVWALISDNRGFLFGLAGILVILAYYLIVWYWVGKDPEKGVIVTRYSPPGDMSPAAMRYVWNRGYDDPTFTAALINLAVKGYLTVKETFGEYSVQPRSGERKAQASQDEEKVYGALFNQRQEVFINQANQSIIKSAVSALKRNLEYGYEKSYFVHNRWYFAFGLLLTLGVVVVSGIHEALDQGNLPLFFFISLWLTIWSVGVAVLLVVVIKSWMDVVKDLGKFGKLIQTIILTLFALPFVGGEILGLYFLAFQATSVPLAILFVVSIGITLIFYELLKAVTPLGRKRLDEIEGFRVFLEAAEKDRLNFMHSPERTPELFEKFLPYALALSVEQRWAEQFSKVLSSAAAEGRSPGWYSSRSMNTFSAGALASTLGDSLSSAVASSSGSSGSGSSGGGSSGGGGGGGGGGGW